jgi:DNA-binding MurR/RpiR family transcriptional regulator
MRHIALVRPRLTPALGRVADYLLRHPLKSATLTIEELAAATQTSPAAVNRLARALELGGYSGLKAALVETLHELLSPVDKLRAELAQRPSGVFGLQEQLRTSQANLSAVEDANREEVFECVVTTLAQARRIYVLGFGNSAYLAGMAAANLVPFCADATAVCMEGGNEHAAYRLAMIGPSDVLLAISLPRYSLDTARLARFASDRGAKVVAITDSPASPLAEIADYVLYAPVEHPVLTSSNVTALTIIEGLVAAVMARNKEAVSLAAELTESVLSYLQVSKAEGGDKRQ